MTRPAAYLFDMDGLLLDSERVYLSQALALLEPTGQSKDDIHAFFLTLVGRSGAEAMALITAYLGDSKAAADFNTVWHKQVASALEQKVALRPTVRRSLATLSDQGCRMAVVTSTHGHRARQHLKNAGLLDHFETVTGGDEVSANKPDPAPYLETATALGLDPRHCAAFEDSDAGTTSATRAGCQTIQIPDLRPIGLALPDLGQRIAPNLWHAICLINPRLNKA